MTCAGARKSEQQRPPTPKPKKERDKAVDRVSPAQQLLRVSLSWWELVARGPIDMNIHMSRKGLHTHSCMYVNVIMREHMNINVHITKKGMKLGMCENN